MVYCTNPLPYLISFWAGEMGWILILIFQDLGKGNSEKLDLEITEFSTQLHFYFSSNQRNASNGAREGVTKIYIDKMKVRLFKVLL